MFFSPDDAGAIRQGEILSDVTNFVYDPIAEEVLGPAHSFAIVISQDCDLERVFAADSEDSLTEPVLLLPASPIAEGREQAGLNTRLWAHVKTNDNPRYHVLQSCGAEADLKGGGIPHLLIDFRKFFIVTHRQLKWQIEAGDAIRRSCLTSPYREHLQNRSMSYFGRVPLDPPHDISGAGLP